MDVQTIEEGISIQPDHIYIIPSGNYVYIQDSTLHLIQRKEDAEKRLPIDLFFRSLGEAKGKNAVAIVLSGTGTDGSLGVKDVKEHLGLVMAQDLLSARYDGMPKSAVDTGLVDYVLSPSEMPSQLIKYNKNRTIMLEGEHGLKEGHSTSIKHILSLVRTHTGNDFSNYKMKTITRRVEHRMAIHNLQDTSAYLGYLRTNPGEIEQLQKDLLISVTRFFRDPEALAALKEKVLNDLFPRFSEGATMRIWVPACATGEEVYSIAIIIQECMDEANRTLDVQIFGTDIDARAINVARGGLYPDNIGADVGAERLGKYFVFENGRYRVRKNLREMAIFAAHNLLSDPPFSRIDLVSCRNLLIYLDSKAQEKVAAVLAYASNPGALLFLGTSESLTPFSEYFRPLDEKARIAERMKYPIPVIGSAGAPHRVPEEQKRGTVLSAVNGRPSPDWRGMIPEVEKILLDRFTPPTAIIDGSGDIVYIHGDTGKYLRPAVGHATNNIISMSRKGIKSYLSSGILRASKEGKENEVKNIKFDVYGNHELVDIKVVPFTGPEVTEGLLAVVFEEARPVKPSKKGPNRTTLDSNELQERLAQTDKQLNAVTIELEGAREEIRSLHEEMESNNEEFQSTSEELETSREELQSVNEELLTVNNELQQRIENLANLNNDMKNLLNNTDIAIIFLDTKLTLRRYTEPSTKFVKLVKTDIGRPFATFSINVKGLDLLGLAQEVIETLELEEREIQTSDGKWYLMRLRPYRSEENTPDGVVITFVDITSRKQAEMDIYEAAEEAKKKAQRLEAILKSMNDGLLELDKQGRVIFVNPPALSQLDVRTIDDYAHSIEFRTLDGGTIPQKEQPFKKVIEGEQIANQEFEVRKKGTRRMFIGSLNGNPIIDQEGKVTSAIVTIRDVTALRQARQHPERPRSSGRKRAPPTNEGDL